MGNLKMSLDDTTFKDLKRDFDNVLNSTIQNMYSKGSDEASLTIKLNISIKEVEVPDYSMLYQDSMRKTFTPSFTHKVSSVLQIKNEQSGKLGGNYELVYDELEKVYVMKPIENSQQYFEGFDDE